MTLVHSGRLELTWTNKHRVLLSHENQTYEWVEPADYRVSEIRLLHGVMTVGQTASEEHRATDNLLIRGDALHALNALTSIPEFAREYLGRVKLVYIDPPFNTGQAFAQYDDELEHSVWLTMLRDRVREVARLLADDGILWVHLDDAEVHRARMILDEELGIGSYLGTVVWQKADSPRSDLPNFSTDHDTLLVYGRTPNANLNRGERDEALNAKYKSPDGDPQPWFDDNPTAPSAHRNQTWVYAIQSPITGELMYPANGRCWATKQETVLAAMSEWAPYELRVLDDDAKRGEVCGVPVSELRKGIPALMLAVPLGEARRSAEARKAAGPWPEYILRSKGTIGRKRPQPNRGSNTRTMWFNEEVGHNREAKAEIKALFPDINAFATPKPERLLKKIIEVSTSPGDIVLDCFVGSGTTAAVAHKLGRRWIAIEVAESTVRDFTLPRLTKVVNGEQGGVSLSRTRAASFDLPGGLTVQAVDDARRVVQTLLDGADLDVDASAVQELLKQMRTRPLREQLWSGGGGFRVLDIGPSMFEVLDRRVYLADWAVNGALGEAVAAQLGYDYAPDGPFCGSKGKMRLAVVDGLVNQGVIRLLVDALPAEETLVVCGTAIDPEAQPVLRTLRPGSTMKKVPSSILDEYRTRRRDRLALAAALDWAQASAMIDDDIAGPTTQVAGAAK